MTDAVSERDRAIARWNDAPVGKRSQELRAFIAGEMRKGRDENDRLGVPMSELSSSQQLTLLDTFIANAIIDRRDDKPTARLAEDFFYSLNGSDRATVPNMILYLKAVGPRVSAALLRASHEQCIPGQYVGGALGWLNPDTKLTVSYYREASQRYIMTEAERRIHRKIGETAAVYRGAVWRGCLEETARSVSWAREIDVARWYAGRVLKGQPVLLFAEAPKEAILAVRIGRERMESEVIVDPTLIRNVAVLE